MALRRSGVRLPLSPPVQKAAIRGLFCFPDILPQAITSDANSACGLSPADHAGSVFLCAVLKRMKELGLNQSELDRRMNASRPYVIHPTKRAARF